MFNELMETKLTEVQIKNKHLFQHCENFNKNVDLI